jgi:membrane protease YdiL (CAAX protease family)
VLPEPLTWRPEDTVPVLLLSIPILFYPISYYVPRTFRGLLARRGFNERRSEIWRVVLERLFGAATLGLPCLLATLWLPPVGNRYGVNLDHAGLSLAAAAISISIVWIVLRYTAQAWPAGFKGYPQMKVRCWDRRLMILNTESWIVYLLAHEFLFRGVLLYQLAAIFGAWPAIAITTGLHSFKHLTREPQEQVVTIFVGVWFGGLGLFTGSILAPLLIHCFTASYMDIAAIRTVPGASVQPRCPDDAP